MVFQSTDFRFHLARNPYYSSLHGYAVNNSTNLPWVNSLKTKEGTNMEKLLEIMKSTEREGTEH